MKKIHNIQWHQDCKTDKQHEPEITQNFTSLKRAIERAKYKSTKIHSVVYVNKWDVGHKFYCCFTDGKLSGKSDGIRI